MGHNPATRDIKKGEKKASEALRTPEERLAAIRGSLTAKLFVTPDDQRFLLDLYDNVFRSLQQTADVLDVANAHLTDTREAREYLTSQVVELQAQVEQFRTVYEQENRSTTVKVERTPTIAECGHVFIPNSAEPICPACMILSAAELVIE